MIEDAKEAGLGVWNATKDAAVARLASPILGPFLLSWAACNYRFFFILFSDSPLETRFQLIDQWFSLSWGHLLGRGFAFPALITAAYILLLPFGTEAVHRWNLKMKRRLREAELESAKVELLTRQESNLRVHQMQQQEEKLRKLEAKASLARKSELRWKLAAMSDDEMFSDGHQVMREFLQSAAFEFRKAGKGGPPLSQIVFLDDGGAFFSNDFLATTVRVSSWALNGLDLILFDSSENAVGNFEFRHSGSYFSGQLSDIDLDLAHSDFIQG